MTNRKNRDVMRGQSRMGILPDTGLVTEVQGVEEGSVNMGLFEFVSKAIRGWLMNTSYAKAWQVAGIHSALQRGDVTVHNIRPIGGASYIIQIDDNLDIDKVAVAWKPTMMQQLMAGKDTPIRDIRQREFADALRMETDETERPLLLESGVKPPSAMVRQSNNRHIVAPSNQPSYATLVNLLLRAAGVNVAKCEELTEGGYGTRYFALSMA